MTDNSNSPITIIIIRLGTNQKHPKIQFLIQIISYYCTTKAIQEIRKGSRERSMEININ